ncbi:type 2 DNA topoisomerase 6 subunit B-like isoform X1 [Panicum virgatum]|uniref:Type 2 DNA topoisomerase 6 subunit B-like n=1 Tax=Panicum virgatum TaxID=38727 RepID=A0A8T0TBP9_PANVG|nr:type 2 DNA topoisomerase 6 subunit B-like isoform X1 [Panicum virgatum]KAG2608420.1 hypothetical protein PVAP13_4NG318700 [Panicum virgatum]
MASSISASSPHRKLLRSLVYSAVQRCRMSESPCRLTVSVKRPAEAASASLLRVSVSDTGVGSKLEEFLELDVLARETPVEKWDGTLLITTTGGDIKCKIHQAGYHIQKSCNIQILILRAPNLACELFVEQIGNAESRNVCLLQDSDDVHHSVMTSSSDRLVSGLKDYALSHGNTCDKCDTCILNRDLLKIGTGAANSVDRRKAKGLHVEVVIVIARTASDLCCWTVNCSSTQVLYFEDFVPCPISQSSFDVLLSTEWQSYGFKLKGGFIDDEGNTVLEWNNMPFARVDIAIHTYLECAMQEGQGSQQDRHLVRKALKSALSHLKADHAGDFLSCHGQRVREYVPDLAESIAGLILSSNDKEFQDECVTLLGLGSDQDVSEGLVQSSICEKMIHIIVLNDTKENVDDNAPYLFECEKLDEEDGDEDTIFDF